MSDIERKRSNVSSNNSIEKSSEYSLINDDEIENKKSKKSPERNILIECLTTPDVSTRRVITSKEQQSDSSPPSLLSFSADSINEEFISQVHRIISSWNNHLIESNIQESSLDCCDSNQSNTSDYWDSFHTSFELRSTMINISKRLTQMQTLVIVDTHCHFDLIFDRLYIKHNNLEKYFDDYKDFYPPGLSFELAIHVFWRPKHLTKKKWMHWYSKYLDDKRVYGSCGIHPHWSSLWTETSAEDIERCLQHPKIVAIGEIGLDFGPKNTCNIEQQCRVFEEQLKLAVKWLKPVVIHSRDAYQQTFEIMKRNLQANHKIHLHCFVGTIDDVHLFTSYFTEIKFGFTPIITRGNSLHTVIQQLNLSQILSETDSPYFVPEELSNLSRSAHPGMVYSVIEIIAQLRQVPIHDIACQLRDNAYHMYNI